MSVEQSQRRFADRSIHSDWQQLSGQRIYLFFKILLSPAWCPSRNAHTSYQLFGQPFEMKHFSFVIVKVLESWHCGHLTRLEKRPLITHTEIQWLTLLTELRRNTWYDLFKNDWPQQNVQFCLVRRGWIILQQFRWKISINALVIICYLFIAITYTCIGDTPHKQIKNTNNCWYGGIFSEETSGRSLLCQSFVKSEVKMQLYVFQHQKVYRMVYLVILSAAIPNLANREH